MSELDLLYIHPSATSSAPSFLFMPAGIFGLLNEVKARNFSVAAVNEPLEMAMDPGFRLEEFVRTHPAKVYAFDLHWHEHAYGVSAAIARVHGVHPDARIVLGGMTASYFASEITATQPAVDWVVRGYGEGMLVDLVAAVCAGEPPAPGVIVADLRTLDVDAPDQVDLSRLVHSQQYTQVSIHQWHPEWRERLIWYRNGLGCPHNCSFCGGSASTAAAIFGRRPLVRRSATRVAADLAALARQGITTVALSQDISDADEAYLETLGSAMAASGTRIGIYLEVNGLSSRRFVEYFARTFDAARSTIAITPLAEDEPLRRRNGKRFTNDDLWTMLSAFVDHGVRTAVYYASGLPGESAASRARTHLQMLAIRRRFSAVFCTSTPLTLDPGSPMYARPERHGIRARLSGLADYEERGRRRSAGAPRTGQHVKPEGAAHQRRPTLAASLAPRRLRGVRLTSLLGGRLLHPCIAAVP